MPIDASQRSSYILNYRTLEREKNRLSGEGEESGWTKEPLTRRGNISDPGRKRKATEA